MSKFPFPAGERQMVRSVAVEQFESSIRNHLKAPSTPKNHPWHDGQKRAAAVQSFGERVQAAIDEVCP
jgi:hypothetical protein